MKRLRSLLGAREVSSARTSSHSGNKHSRLAVESLEARMLLAADCFGGLDPDLAQSGCGGCGVCSACTGGAEMHVLFDQGTPQNYVDQVHATIGHSHSQPGDNISRFQASTRWSNTTTDGGGLSWGDGTTVTWSIAPDGTSIGGFAGEPSAPSNFVSFMAGIYGSNSGGIENQPWFSIVASTFDRWSEVTGLNFVYEPNDDGAAYSGANGGVQGVRGDIRIGGHAIDGNSGTLAYNFFPNNGDMVIDTADSFYNNTGGNSIRLRNVMAHEIGHGIGIAHVEPVNGTKLMEPFINLSFDGPQHDDILAGHRLYGDQNELGDGNDTFGNATDLGTLSAGTITIGDHAAEDYLSIDDNGDADYFSFTVGAGASLDATLSPIGFTYQQGPQGGSSSSFNSQAQSDLRLDIYDANFQLIVSADNTGIGSAETLNDVALTAGGVYYARVTGADDAAQFYQLDITTTDGGDPPPPPPADVINFNDYSVDPYGGRQDFTGTSTVEQNGAALHLTGNRWKKIDFPYTVTANTVLEFDFASSSQGEIHGIGFDTDTIISSNRTFRVYGTQNWGIGTFDNYTPSGTQQYVIPVGQFYTGSFAHLFFTSDHDVSNPSSDSIFSNVRIYEDGNTPDAPVAVDDTATVAEDSGTTTLNVIGNDDDSGGTLTITNVSSGSASGTVAIGANNTVNYTPSANFFGTETFTYTVSNGGGEATATVTVTVNPVNDLPTAADDEFTVDGGSSNNILNVLGNDSISPDTSETLTITGVGNGSAGGTITINANNTISYTPVAGFIGVETFTYTVNDGTPDSNATATVSVNVAPQLPTAVNDTFTLDEDSGTTSLAVLLNDNDGGGNLSISNVSSGSAGGTISIGANNTISYAPAANFFGTETFTYTISNEAGQSTATVTVTVQPVNDLPTANSDAFTVDEDSQDNVLNVLANDSISPDTNETLTIVAVGAGSAGGTITTDGSQLFYTPVAGFSGDETFTYTANDGTTGSNATATVTVTVDPLQLPGVINFNDFSIDSYGGRQDFNGSFAVENGGTTLRLNGNTWKKIDLPYTITANTVLEFDFSSTSQGEIHGIGFDTNNIITSSRTFHVYGTQNWGNRTFDNYAGSAGSTVHYTIPVGQFYTGNVINLFFTNDHDVLTPTAESVFSNVRVYEANQVQAATASGQAADRAFALLGTGNTTTSAPQSASLPSRATAAPVANAAALTTTTSASQFLTQHFTRRSSSTDLSQSAATSNIRSDVPTTARLTGLDRFFAGLGRRR